VFHAIPKKTDPRRFFRSHRERGPRRFFTFADIAIAADEALTTTRSNLRCTDDARTVAIYITNALVRRSRKLTDEELVAVLGQDTLPAWQARWPRFDLYSCGMPSCTDVLLEPGLCGQHGGPSQPLVVLHDNHFALRVGREYIPICHLVLGATTRDFAARHRDGNSWNSRPDNLEPAEHAPRLNRAQWSYGYRELADLFGLSEDGTRQAVSRGSFNPRSLSSITSFWFLRNKKDL